MYLYLQKKYDGTNVRLHLASNNNNNERVKNRIFCQPVDYPVACSLLLLVNDNKGSICNKIQDRSDRHY
ncbi:hypothetical protein DERP_000148 [Dermatophagoides pteronyssinus]|uniref:Uncharacterized protein n=1 Tax=Dermatophagoides pteronyssinus TaxID=6956 RepID=A0ABQ8IZC2_DERPT|nr:hypothetical protein DERP_000148 [Dermatophagoides pteronyssinus]